jgi:large subunit ribosomal protein L21
MKARIAALLAAAGAAAAAAGAAVWSRRKEEDKASSSRETAEAETVEVTNTPDAAPRDASAGATGSHDAGAADDLTQLKGIGAVSAERLAGIGVTTFAQLASWSDEDLQAHAAEIKVSPDRIRREDWVGQARAASDEERPS